MSGSSPAQVALLFPGQGSQYVKMLDIAKESRYINILEYMQNTEDIKILWIMWVFRCVDCVDYWNVFIVTREDYCNILEDVSVMYVVRHRQTS